MRNGVHVRVDLRQQTRRLHARDDFLARDETVEPVIGQRLLELFRGRHVTQERVIALNAQIGLGIEHADQRQLVPASDFEIVEIMGRRDLDRAGALLRVGIGVGDDRDAPSDQR